MAMLTYIINKNNKKKALSQISYLFELILRLKENEREEVTRVTTYNYLNRVFIIQFLLWAKFSDVYSHVLFNNHTYQSH